MTTSDHDINNSTDPTNDQAMTEDRASNPADPRQVDEGQLEAYAIVSPDGVRRRNIIHAGVTLGVFEALTDTPVAADEVIDELDLDSRYGYRLLRALANYDVVTEHEDGRFSLTRLGEYFQADHPRSLRAVVLSSRHPVSRSVWTHLPDIVKDGGPDGYVREFGCDKWTYHERDPEFAACFNEEMTVGSQLLTPQILEALAETDLERFETICDVGGGHGQLLTSLLRTWPNLEGLVFDLPSVVENESEHYAPLVGVEDRCTYVAGDMFDSVPIADAYIMKHVLHDWTDDECVEILTTIHRDAIEDARLYVAEFVVPESGESHLSKQFDITMMVGVGGRERTESEWRDLLDDAGWTLETVLSPAAGPMRVIEAKPE